FNLFVIQGQTGMNILRIAAAAIPFFLLIMVALVMITIFPEIVTVLPNMMSG
ncbi:MAG: C4-dicarboxylate ABC transporter permease, partial [Desulfofustis sp.]|nr:C4-dicarboxylate ABC transporter permease [Desulfofustis sp.]